MVLLNQIKEKLLWVQENYTNREVWVILRNIEFRLPISDSLQSRDEKRQLCSNFGLLYSIGRNCLH